MARERAGFDLHLDIRGPRVRAALEAALREAVRSGRLPAGARMPSSRTLARDLGLARNTVANAYGQLVAEGWLTARSGAGTRVATGVALDGTTAVASEPSKTPALPYNLLPGVPDLSEFPRAAWLAAARRALSRAPANAFSYGDPRGRLELRTALAEYLARARGVRATPDRIMICSGAVHGLSTLCTALARQGVAEVAVENIGFFLHRDAIRATGLAITPMTVDESGARTDELGAAGAGVALLTPAHQFPTGVPLAAARRTAAIDWARRVDGLLIEDDYDGEFRYDGQPVGALQALDPDRVVYVGSASKTLVPGLRLAWMVLPQRMVEPVCAVRETTDLHTGVLEQLTLAEFMRSGGYDRHVRRSRLRYRQRRDRLVTTLADRAPHVSVSGIAAGLHALLMLPGDRGMEEMLIERAAGLGLALTGLAPFRFTSRRTDRGGLVVGYARPPGHAFAGALDALCATLT